MSVTGQKVATWGGPFFVTCLGIGLFLAHFLPPPGPNLSAEEVAAFYQAHAWGIRGGMILGLTGIAGWCSLVGAISVQMRRMQGAGRLPAYIQLGSGSIGVLTVMFPIMIFAITAFRPERDPALTQLLNDVGWLIIIPAFPTFIAQFLAIAWGTLADQGAKPVYPRWSAFFNAWIVVLFLPGALSFCIRTGPFAWNGLLAFWVAAGAFFVWLLVMTFLNLRAIGDEPA